MNILILGAGEVGATLAENLAKEPNTNITIVDTDPSRLKKLQDNADIRTVCGLASHPNVLRKAGADDTEIFIAVTNSDEVNMVACQMAHTLFRIPRKISRIRSSAYLNEEGLFSDKSIPIDVPIAPEQLVTNSLKRLLEFPGALQVMDFADGKVQLVCVKAFDGGPMIGHQIKEIRKHMPSVDARVAAIYRQGGAIEPTADTRIKPNDEVFFIAAKENIKPVMKELRRVDTAYKRIIIAGGGNIGERFALAIEKRYNVKLIERSLERCEYLTENLDRTLVTHGSASDKALLEELDIDRTDVFLALTNDDEANIMASLLAKKLGAKKVITLITNPNYVDLIQGENIDVAISPQLITIGKLLTYIRKGDVSSVHTLRRGAAEALELVVHGDPKTSRIIGRSLGNITLPKGVTIGAIVRGEEVLIAHKHIVVQNEDHLIMFLVDRRQIEEVDRIFSVGINYF